MSNANLFLQRVTEMMKVDQDLRFSGQSYLIYVTDFVHGQRLRALIRRYGYPRQKTFGPEGMAALWLLVQHQDYDIELQKACLKSCDFAPEHRAHLLDRIAVNEGKEQTYGTQFTGTYDAEGYPIWHPIKDMKKLDQRRKQAGLGTFEDTVNDMKKKV